MIYFIKSDSGHIKIGHTKKNPQARLKALQIGSPDKLIILKTIRGGYAMETHLHSKFKHLHVFGEWFSASPELLHFIENYTVGCHTSGYATRSTFQLSHALSAYRASADKSQAELGKSAGIRQATVSKVEKGVDSTEIGTIYALCAALDLELVLRPRNKEPFVPEDHI